MEKKKNSKKKLYATRTVKLSCFFLALILTLSAMQHLFLRRLDQNSIRIDAYYLEEKDSLDVVSLGASDVYTCFAAGRAYEKYGFTSFPFATESITASGMMTALKEVVRTQKPQLILIETNAFLYGNNSNETNEAHMRKLIDNLPMNENRIEFILNNVKPDDRMEYFFPLIKYHGLWTEYPDAMRRVISKIQQDFRGTSYLKGFRTTTTAFSTKNRILNEEAINENKASKLNPTLEKKLREMLEYCKKENLNVVFIRTPHLIYEKSYERVKRSNRAGEIINSYGFSYINMERDWKKIGIDPKKDFYNFDHLNIYGATKLTDYLGKIIVDDLGIKGEPLSDANKKKWDEAAKCFEQLYRYCDDLIKRHEEIKLEEDINTLDAISKY